MNLAHEILQYTENKEIIYGTHRKMWKVTVSHEIFGRSDRLTPLLTTQLLYGNIYTNCNHISNKQLEDRHHWVEEYKLALRSLSCKAEKPNA